MTRLLLVEDDPSLGKGLQVALELEGYEVLWKRRLLDARQSVRADAPGLVLLDLGLPDGDGLSLLEDLRREGSPVPVVVLTAQTEEDTVVRALRGGANDYVRKPFGNLELLARLEAALRGPLQRSGRLEYDRLVLHTDRRVATYEGKDLDLKRREFDLLQHLMEHAEAVVTRDALLTRFGVEGEIFDRTVDSHVSHLRSRLRQNGARGVRIQSVYGVGYRLERA